MVCLSTARSARTNSVLENAKIGALLRVDLHEGKALSDFPLPTHGETLSYALAVLPLPGLLCVTDFNADQLYLLEPSSGNVLAQLFVGDGPDAMAELE